MMMVRGPGKAPALLSGGDCSAVSQFIPGKDLQEVLRNHHNPFNLMSSFCGAF